MRDNFNVCYRRKFRRYRKINRDKINDETFMFPMTDKLFNYACMSGNQKLIKFLQDKNVRKMNML